MNSTLSNQPPPPALQPSVTCHLHRHLNHNSFTPFCSSCLFERLNTQINHSSSLRRTKSYSASKIDNLKSEPQRKSCDVRSRNTLLSLFSIDDQQLNNHHEIRVSEEIRNLDELENDIVEMEAKIDEIVDNLKSVIDLDSHSKKPSFWTKKWQNWRRKQNINNTNVDDYTLLPLEKPISQQYRETQSEIADYRRSSCDIDPTRFSLDAGRVSFDDPPPRPSWDGYFIAQRPNMQIPVVEEHQPGGSTQTREYYSLNSSSRRRKSLDRSTSIRRMAAPDIIDDDDDGDDDAPDANHRSRCHSIGSQNELQRDICISNSLRDDASDSLGKEGKKKSRWWNWKQWGFQNADNGELKRGVNRKVDIRNNTSNVSWRRSMKKSNSIENCKARQQEGDEYVFERNTSARYPPNNLNNGLLQFYLTPLRGSRRSSRLPSNSNSIARNMLRLY